MPSSAKSPGANQHQATYYKSRQLIRGVSRACTLPRTVVFWQRKIQVAQLCNRFVEFSSQSSRHLRIISTTSRLRDIVTVHCTGVVDKVRVAVVLRSTILVAMVHVLAVGARVAEGLVALAADVRLLSSVQALMLREMVLVLEGFFTHVTLERTKSYNIVQQQSAVISRIKS